MKMQEKAPRFIPKDELKKPDTAQTEIVTLIAKVKMPTKYGLFDLYGFNDTRSGLLHTALVKGDVDGSTECAVRIHSECHTGDVLGSMRCDCGEQLKEAMSYISDSLGVF